MDGLNKNAIENDLSSILLLFIYYKASESVVFSQSIPLY